MAGSLQVPKDLDDKKALRSFLVALSNNNGTGDIIKNHNIYPTTSVPMDTTVYDEAILYSELNMMFKSAGGKSYKEYTITDGKLLSIDVWEDDFKTVKMFTKTFTYTGDYITGVTLTDEVESLTLTKTLTFVDGVLSTEEII